MIVGPLHKESPGQFYIVVLVFQKTNLASTQSLSREHAPILHSAVSYLEVEGLNVLILHSLPRYVEANASTCFYIVLVLV